jgi:hypothetical protein
LIRQQLLTASQLTSRKFNLRLGPRKLRQRDVQLRLGLGEFRLGLNGRRDGLTHLGLSFGYLLVKLGRLQLG